MISFFGHFRFFAKFNNLFWTDFVVLALFYTFYAVKCCNNAVGMLQFSDPECLGYI